MGLVGLTATGSVIWGGIRWISVIGAWLFFLVFACFVLVGEFRGSLWRLGEALWAYISSLPRLSTLVAGSDQTQSSLDLITWQTDWTIFCWTWWIAFAPFVALFLARVSRGRSLRGFICGCLFMPVGVSTVWFAYVGGAALGVQLNPDARIDLMTVPMSAQVFETIHELAPSSFGTIWSGLVALLLMLLLITTLSAAILAINTISAAGDERCRVPFHIGIWGGVVSVMIGSLVAAGGTGSIRDAMIIGALPFSFVIALSGISTVLSLVFEARRSSVPSLTIR